MENKLRFDKNAENIREKGCRKSNALTRKRNWLHLTKKYILMNAFYKSQFNYCHDILMFHSRLLSNKIYKQHENYFRIKYNDKDSSFEDFLF